MSNISNKQIITELITACKDVWKPGSYIKLTLDNNIHSISNVRPVSNSLGQHIIITCNRIGKSGGQYQIIMKACNSEYMDYSVEVI